jgi:hypothetical protein
MEFDYTDYEYLPECRDGCGALTDWLPSNDAAHEVGLAHQKLTAHHWQVQQRMKELSIIKEAPRVPQKSQDLRK